MFKSKQFLGAFAACGILTAVTSSAQVYQPLGGAYAEGDLLVGFTTGADNDLIVNLGAAASVLSNGNQWNLGSLLTGNLAGLNNVSWGIVGCATGPSRVYTTMTGTTLPNHFNNLSQFNAIVTALSGLGLDLSDPSGYGTPSASVAGDGSWYNGTDIVGTQTFYSNYGNPNGSTASGLPSTLDFYTVLQGSSGTRTLNGTFTITSAGILTFNTTSTKPTAGFMGVPTSGYAPLPVVFTDASSGNITNWVWNFGDGNSITNSSNASVTNTYATAGNYTVTLTVAGAGGANTDTQSNYVTVSTPSTVPTAGFTGTPTTGYAPLPVVFTDASSGSITNWVWSFGDGNSITNGSSSSVTNTYAAAGSYTVALTVSGPGGANTNTKSSYVVVSTLPAAPTAGFTGGPTSGYAPLPVVFTDASSGSFTNEVWSFGDGSFITNSTGTSANATHTYTAAGTYTVTLTVSGPGGVNTNTQINYVAVSAPPAVPVAGFTATPTSGYAPLPVVFSDTSSGSITNWVWNFGNGRSITNSTAANVTNLYAAVGSYTVALTVSGPGGVNTATHSSYVTVSNAPAPTAGFTAMPTNGYAPLPVIFADASSGSITNWVWNFGNGHSLTNTTGGEVTNIYAAAGKYAVSLKVTGPGGANTNSKSNYVIVSNAPAPTAGFAGTPTNGFAPLQVAFTDASSGDITNWVWNFGDGHSVTNSAGGAMAHSYTAAGKFTVSLKVAGPGGTSTSTKTSYVSVTGPVAAFTATPTNGFGPLQVLFTDMSGGTITNWVWNFGDSHSITNSTGGTVTHTYIAAGKYTVSLKVVGVGGANTNTKTSYVTVAGPVAGFTATPTNGFAPLQVVFSDASGGNITNWVWNFGDGHSVTNTTSDSVTNIYAAAGKYTVSLKVAGPAGANTNTKTSYVTVAGPVAGFTATPTNGIAPLQVVFSDTSGGNITNWVWNFGNGHSVTNTTSDSVTNIYAAVGKYTVSLKVSGVGGANTNTKTSYVTVSTPPAPKAGFTATPTNGSAPLQVVFSDASSGNITNWVWNFGNGHSLTNTVGGEVTNTYAAATNYTVTLKVAGLGGASTVTKTNYIVVSRVPNLEHFKVACGSVSFSGTNGSAGQSYRVLMSTDLVNWVPVATNLISSDGTYACTNLMTTNQQAFFRLVVP